MNSILRAARPAFLLSAALVLAACGNRGAVDKPSTAQTTNSVPGTGAGQSETGATGGSAANGSTAAGETPGTTAGGEGRAATEGSAPTPSR